jgi:hypothetical protein
MNPPLPEASNYHPSALPHAQNSAPCFPISTTNQALTAKPSSSPSLFPVTSQLDGLQHCRVFARQNIINGLLGLVVGKDTPVWNSVFYC